MKKLISTLAIALIAVFGLASCVPTVTFDDNGKAQVVESGQAKYVPNTSVFTKKLDNGKEVTCIWAVSPSNSFGGPSCDWESLHSDSNNEEVE